MRAPPFLDGAPAFYAMLSQIRPETVQGADMAKYTPNTQNVIQILVAAVITMVILDLLHVWG